MCDDSTIPDSRHAVISRAEAMARGLRFYFHGKACRRGHVGQRYAADGKCVECLRLRTKEYAQKPKAVTRRRQHRAANRDKINEQKRVLYAANPKPARAQAKRWAEENAERKRAADAAWASANPERRRANARAWRAANLEKVRADNAAWRATNVEYLRAYSTAWRANNAESYRANIASWKKENPEAVKTYWHNRRARKLAAPGSHTAADIDRIRSAQKGKCGYCAGSLKKLGEHVDHIIALSRGGSNDPANLQVLCPSCNSRKRAKDPIQFAQELGRLL